MALKAPASDLLILKTLEDAIEGADVILLLVDHQEFKNISPQAMVHKGIVDTRGIWT
ncbi:UDP-N-acetyl-D-mannosamine dehydrogenase [compost metagenome]